MNNLLKSTLVLIIFIMFTLSVQAIQPTQDPNDHQSTTGPFAPTGIFIGTQSVLLDYQVVIPNVPAYIWYNGCGPTASGMIIGYWDGQGFDNLISGSAKTQTDAVNDMISSSGNYIDYVLPMDSYVLLPDKSEPPFGDEHADDSVADFMKTSQSYYGNFYGWSWYSHADDSLRRYAQSIYPQYNVTVHNDVWGTFTWDSFRAEIDANHPVELLVDTDGNGQTDHFITAIGYGEQGGKPMYASFNTWDTSIHWYEFSRISVNQLWGIYGATIFYLESPPPTTYIVPLTTGWNLISVPLNISTWILGDESAVENPLKVTPPNCISSIYRYNTSSKSFEKSDHFDDWGWYPATGSESFTKLEPGRGYWVITKSNCNLTFSGTPPDDLDIPLAKGWNLVGWYSTNEALLGQESNVGDPLNVTPKNTLTSIYRYDTASGQFEKSDHFDNWGWYPATGSEGFTELEPGRGYWVMAQNDALWRHNS